MAFIEFIANDFFSGGLLFGLFQFHQHQKEDMDARNKEILEGAIMRRLILSLFNFSIVGVVLVLSHSTNSLSTRSKYFRGPPFFLKIFVNCTSSNIFHQSMISSKLEDLLFQRILAQEKWI